VRVDYRNGSNLTGWDGTGGFRYSFTPEAVVRRAMPVKAPVLKAPASRGVTWDGFYVGAFGGGRSAPPTGVIQLVRSVPGLRGSWVELMPATIGRMARGCSAWRETSLAPTLRGVSLAGP
jgi:hypothetical protein